MKIADASGNTAKQVIEFMLFLARPLRDKCSSVAKGDKQVAQK
jgi:hypothetical protein